MRYTYLPGLWALLAVVGLMGPPAVASAPEVRDEAHLFQPETLEKVNATIRQIKQKYDKDLAVETFAEIPPAMRARFTAQGKEAFYEEWLHQEARQAKTNGVFILIVKTPGHLQVDVGNQTRLKAFTDKDRRELATLMLAKFREKKFDEGMVEGATFVLERMGQNLEGKAPVGPVRHTTSATQPSTRPEPQTQAATAPAGDVTPGPATRPATDRSGPATKPEAEVKPSGAGGIESIK